jgi:hypothetical protein
MATGGGISAESKVLDFWSVVIPQVQLTAVAADVSLSPITVRTLVGVPGFAIAFLKFRTIENTNAADNAINAAQSITLGSVPVLSFSGGELAVPASSKENGDVIIGTIDISSYIAAGTLSFIWTSSRALFANLELNDVQVGIRIWIN